MLWTRRGEHWSLAVRLAFWYALSAFLLLSIGTGLLYWGLVRRFEQQNDQYLKEKASGLARLLEEPSQRMDTVRWEVEEESIGPSSVRILSRIQAANGKVLFETSTMGRDLPLKDPLPDVKVGDPVDIKTSGGKHFRVVVSTFSGSKTNTYRQRFQVMVAVDLGYEERLLQSYLDQLWIVLAVGLVAAAAIGYRLAKRGIAPVQTMADTVKHIGSSTLGERVALSGMPSELVELGETFNAMLQRLDEAFQRLARFSSDLAHELRTPIGNIRGELEVALTQTRTPEEYSEVAQSSLEECEKLSRLIDRLLFLARSEHPETQIRKDTVDVSEELRRVLEFYEPAASEKAVQLELEIKGLLKAKLDRTLFQIAVGNLVDNAVRHTLPGGEVIVAARNGSGGLIVTVSDNGIGIAPEHLPHVFDRFYRVNPARTHDGGGAGLGLAILQTVARLHQGTVSIESKLGKGTSVTVNLPEVCSAT